jgi:DNA polymerase III subunit delta'
MILMCMTKDCYSNAIEKCYNHKIGNVIDGQSNLLGRYIYPFGLYLLHQILFKPCYLYSFMQFSSVVGQSKAKMQFLSLLQQHRLPHAMLINGAAGAGVLPFAWAAIQYLYCENKTAEDSCGQCASCYKVHSLQHSDVYWSFPVVTKKSGETPISEDFYAEFRTSIKENAYISAIDWITSIDSTNKQGNITARECRHLIQKLSQSSSDADKKVLVMWQPEALGKEGNILLKMIEEPPPDTIIILATENIEHILSTIQSRCQLVSLNPLQTTEIRDALVHNLQLPSDTATNIARLCEGNFSEALQLATDQQEGNQEHFTLFRSLLNAVFTRSGANALAFSEELAKLTRVQQKHFLHYVLVIFEHFIRVQSGLADTLLLHQQEQTVIAKLADLKVDEHIAGQFANSIEKCMQLIERNVNAKIAASSLCINMMHNLVPLAVN